MLPLLIAATAGSIIISAMCSLMEAVLYSFPESVIDHLKNHKKKSGVILAKMKGNIQEPITAILTLNTVANTLGASIAGAAWVNCFGSETLPYFAVAFTIAIFLFSEIFPKTLGVMYCRSLAPYIARPLAVIVFLLYPFVKFTSFVSRRLTRNSSKIEATEEDLRSVVKLALRSGEIEQSEASTIRNVLLMNDKIARNVMTPRNVVKMFPSDMTVAEALDDNLPYSRYPIYDVKNPTTIVGLVYKYDLFERMLDKKGNTKMRDIMRDIVFVDMDMKLNILLDNFIKSRVHIMAVKDEFDAFDGIVSLEDVIEELIGREIVDETDQFEDMQKHARGNSKKIVKTAKKIKKVLKPAKKRKNKVKVVKKK